jgi:hypothetical protein
MEHPDVFPIVYTSRSLYNNYYGQVCTRCFGYGVDSTSMIPMADNFNHSSIEIDWDLINMGLHQNGESEKSYYRIETYLQDVSDLYLNKGYDASELN